MIAALDELRYQHSCDRAVRHSITGIPRHDVDILFIRRISADVPHAVDGLHDLAGPIKSDLAGFWPPRPRPIFKALETLFEIVGLPGLVIFAADDENVVLGAAALGKP